MRLVIIDHARHTLFVEDVSEELINEKYNGEEEEYIKDNYDLVEDEWSWDYVTNAQYINENNDPVEINFEELSDSPG